jgi:hypothetical protein
VNNEKKSPKEFCTEHLEKCFDLVFDAPNLTCFEVEADHLLDGWMKAGVKTRSFGAVATHRAHANWLLNRSAQRRDKFESARRKAELSQHGR